MKYRFFEYSACSSCRKARKALESKGIDFEAIPIVDRPPSAKDLAAYVKKSGLPLKKFLNTSGVLYREMKISEKWAGMSEAEAIELLAKHGKLIKRPLLVGGERVLVGFDEKAYANLKS